MKQKIPFGFFLGVLLLLFILHGAGTYFYFYWRIPYYDLVAHIVGGFWVVSMVLLVVASFFSVRTVGVWVLGLGVAIAAGLIWEVFEVQTGLTHVQDVEYVRDVSVDLIADLVGGLLGVAYVLSRKTNNIKS